MLGMTTTTTGRGVAIALLALCGQALAQSPPPRSETVERSVTDKYLEARFADGYWTRTLFHPGGKYEIWDSDSKYSYGEWWGEERAICFVSHVGKRACWRYRPMVAGTSYDTVSPDGRAVVARLYAAK
jgi:hypothetical protein